MVIAVVTSLASSNLSRASARTDYFSENFTCTSQTYSASNAIYGGYSFYLQISYTSIDTASGWQIASYGPLDLYGTHSIGWGYSMGPTSYTYQSGDLVVTTTVSWYYSAGQILFPGDSYSFGLTATPTGGCTWSELTIHP